MSLDIISKKKHRSGNQKMDIPEDLTTLRTQDTRRRQTKQKNTSLCANKHK